jgi:quercetin dioxygenase-like cupin family protein
MNVYKVLDLATHAVATSDTRPATAIVHDAPDVRLVLFRIEPGQAVPPHVSGSSVLLTVVSGEGVVSGAEGEREVRPGDVACFAPNELHGMRSRTSSFVVLATITPRPGLR